jgi:5-methylcytosine-specific restriction endonuclease McrA
MALRLGRASTATLDHVIPQSQHYNEPRNIKAACSRCNNGKRDMSEADYRTLMEDNDDG